jgi:hypothetical protein
VDCAPDKSILFPVTLYVYPSERNQPHFLSYSIKKEFWEELVAYFLLYFTGSIENNKMKGMHRHTDSKFIS